MSEFSDDMTEFALEQLKEFGEAVTFTATTPGAYDPATATTGAGSTVVYSGFTVPIDYDARDIDRGLVKESDIRIYVNEMTSVPAVGDQVLLDSINYRVITTRKYVINSENVLHELTIRV